MLGTYLIAFSFSTALISAIAYGITISRGGQQSILTVARSGFHAAAVSFMAACAFQMYLILTHHYEYAYVWEHSSNALSTPLLAASFYAGQEGSFMLWTLFTFVIGVFLLGYTHRAQYESPVMTVYTGVLVCLLLILVVKSPFLTIFQRFPEQNIAANFVPPDGKGLNPTLENLWITIHPPILFTGFAAMSVPFVLAIAALIKRDYQRWISIALPWALFASMVLGFGVMLGGWWAYETLGWGGFWGWDPVENSSLIPWLACVALVHTMLVQKRTGSIDRKSGEQRIGGLVKTNFALAVVTFGLVLYSTFLTRSGVLGDTSVHSFVAPGNFVYLILVLINVLFIGTGITAVVWRWRELHRASLEMRLMSRENALGLGSAVILSSAVIVLLGTSWPIIRPLFGMAKAATDPGFFNDSHLIIGIVLVLLNGISMTLNWKNTTPRDFFRKISISVGIAGLGSIGLALLGVTAPVFVLLGFGSLLAIAVNVQIALKVIRGNPRFIGAYVSHTGIALLMLGVIFTSRYSETQHVRLAVGEAKQVFGYKISYGGSVRVDSLRLDQERYQHPIVLEKDGSRSVVTPVTFLSDYNQREAAFSIPGIKYTPTRDIYIATKSIDEEGGDPKLSMHKGDRARLPFDSSMSLRFEKFDMSLAASQKKQGAVVEVRTKDSSFFLTTYRTLSNGSFVPMPIPGTDMAVGFYGLDADKENLSNSVAIFQISSKSHPPGPTHEVITLDVSVKPFISFVWAGVIIMVGGFFFAILRRRREIEPMPEQEIVTSPKPVAGAAGSGAVATRSARR